MHVDHAPRGEDGLLIGILEMAEYLRYHHDALCGRLLIRGGGKAPYALARGDEHVSVIILCEILEQLLGDALGHELLPGAVIHEIDKALDADILIKGHVRTVDHEWHTDGDAAQDINGLFASFLRLLYALTLGDLLRRERRPFGDLGLIGIVDGLDLLVVQALTVYDDLAFFLLCLGRAYDVLELIEHGGVELVKLQKLIVIDGFIVEAAVDCALGIDLLDLLHHGFDAVFLRSGAGYGNDRAVIQKLRHCSAALLLAAAGLPGKVDGLGQHSQSPVGSEIEHVTIRLLLALDLTGGLNTEYGLHVLRGGGRIGAGEHEHRRPLLNGDARRELAAGEGYGIGVVPYYGLDLIEGAVVIILLIIIALARDVGYAKGFEHWVLTEYALQSAGFLYAGNHPERMAEHIAVFLRGEGIVAVLILLDHEVQEGPYILFMNKIALDRACGDLSLAVRAL